MAKHHDKILSLPQNCRFSNPHFVIAMLSLHLLAQRILDYWKFPRIHQFSRHFSSHIQIKADHGTH
jgi:hypothetical protein